MATTLHLLIPGLLGPWPVELMVPRPTAPALEWLLARADVAEMPASMDAVLFHLFGVPIPAETDLPVAAVTALADGGEPDNGWWLRADPVHLRPDVQGVLLVDARALAIESVEAAALAAAFDQTFAADGLQLHVPCPDRWYLRLPEDPGLRTYPLFDAIGRDINPLLPYGPNVRRWHTLLTEAQMLFHSHPVNRARDERNQPMINGLWLWGGGVLPAGAQAPAAELYADDRLTRGLARLAGVAVSPVPENASDWREVSTHDTDSLVVLDLARYDRTDGDPLAWVDHVAAMERDWFAPCRRLLQTGQLAALHLHCGRGRRYSVPRAARWRFWRRNRPVI
ncbi:MAG TPA: hypothetical protein P5102_09620 [Candidatus Competibacteraceae bacterium]|nr:hypothetical protein [Candidatus Competibacteraceae bacterium]HRZ06392.1 hypothetical protein [Candidatus Competibacteraceae bacterium]HSA47338.1 hypothetical protein [Candidatus Competibacteraceae bacterium]